MKPTKQVVPARLEDGTPALLHHFVKGGIIATVSGQKQLVDAKSVPPKYREQLRLRDQKTKGANSNV